MPAEPDNADYPDTPPQPVAIQPGLRLAMLGLVALILVAVLAGAAGYFVPHSPTAGCVASDATHRAELESTTAQIRSNETQQKILLDLQHTAMKYCIDGKHFPVVVQANVSCPSDGHFPPIVQANGSSPNVSFPK